MLHIYKNGEYVSTMSNPEIHDMGEDGYSVTYEVVVKGEIYCRDAVKGVSFYNALEVYYRLLEIVTNEHHNRVDIVKVDDNELDSKRYSRRDM